MKIVIGHSCPVCYSTHIYSHKDNDEVVIICDTCGWKGNFEELNEDYIDVDVRA